MTPTEIFRSIDYIDTQEQLDAYVDEQVAGLRSRIAELEEECEKSAHGCFTRNTRIAELEAENKRLREHIDWLIVHKAVPAP